MTIWYNIGPFGIVCGRLVHFFPFCYVWTKKIWQPWLWQPRILGQLKRFVFNWQSVQFELTKIVPFSLHSGIICTTYRRPKQLPVLPRVARWYIFKPKIPIWVNFGEFCNGRY
jgi:hypothetical protein